MKADVKLKSRERKREKGKGAGKKSLAVVEVKIDQSAGFSIGKMANSCGPVSETLKSLSHPIRLLILGHLARKPCSVSDLVKSCQISQPQVSQFLIRMKKEGILKSERDGQFQIYTISDLRLLKLVVFLHDNFCN